MQAKNHPKRKTIKASEKKLFSKEELRKLGVQDIVRIYRKYQQLETTHQKINSFSEPVYCVRASASA